MPWKGRKNAFSALHSRIELQIPAGTAAAPASLGPRASSGRGRQEEELLRPALPQLRFGFPSCKQKLGREWGWGRCAGQGHWGRPPWLLRPLALGDPLEPHPVRPAPTSSRGGPDVRSQHSRRLSRPAACGYLRGGGGGGEGAPEPPSLPAKVGGALGPWTVTAGLLPGQEDFMASCKSTTRPGCHTCPGWRADLPFPVLS